MPTVFENSVPVGVLSRGEVQHEFTYLHDCLPAQAVSLLMPAPSEERYLSSRAGYLHPVFDQSLPEGALRASLASMFAKSLPTFDNFSLLEIVGRSQIGRLRFASDPRGLDEVPSQDLKQLLRYRGTEELFGDLLRRYAQFSGVAGVQPKLLIRDNGSLESSNFSSLRPDARVTAAGTTHLVKTFDANRLPGLAANEYWCLQAAKAAGLRIASTELSDDGRILIVRRFDLKEDGTYSAFEDGCSLDGRISDDKYEGSYEQLAKTFSNVLRSPRGIEAELEEFFRSLCLSLVVRNGDAHRKNFGVLYDDPTKAVSLAPTYDVLTSTAYLQSDLMALTIDGSKRWPDRRRLLNFGVTRCRLSPKAAALSLDKVCEAVSEVERQLEHAEVQGHIPSDVLFNMKRAWSEGLRTVSQKLSVSVSMTPREPAKLKQQPGSPSHHLSP